jgi:hypothetical protein
MPSGKPQQFMVLRDGTRDDSHISPNDSNVVGLGEPVSHSLTHELPSHATDPLAGPRNCEANNLRRLVFRVHRNREDAASRLTSCFSHLSPQHRCRSDGLGKGDDGRGLSARVCSSTNSETTGKTP